MTFRYSEPVEKLIAEADAAGKPTEVDVLIVGSGYGGSVAAYRLATDPKGPRSIYVFERGKEYVEGDFPRDIGDAPGLMQFTAAGRTGSVGYPDGLFDFRMGDGVD